MANFEITGTIEIIHEEQQVTAAFKKREFVLNVSDGKYAQSIKFQFTGDKTSLLDPFGVSEEVTVSFNIRGNRSDKNGNIMHFVNLNAWKIEATNPEFKKPEALTPIEEDPKDLPF